MLQLLVGCAGWYLRESVSSLVPAPIGRAMPRDWLASHVLLNSQHPDQRGFTLRTHEARPRVNTASLPILNRGHGRLSPELM